MRHRVLVSMGALTVAIVIVSLAPVPVAAQAPSATAKTWTPPRTPDGQPDLQGIWTNDTITPFERPSELAGKQFLTEEEAAELEERTAQRRVESEASADFRSYNQLWLDSGTTVVPTRQTSLVVDPPDGRVPIAPVGEERRDFYRAHSADSYAYMSVWDRCITRGVPGSMFPAGYNNAYRILQIPGYVVIQQEMIHDTRIIPLDGHPHVGPNIRLWMGDSRGRWEGNTLVVDTTNFTDRGWIASNAAAGRVKGIPVSESLHVVERFTRVDADTIHYEATIEDPNVYTRAWTVSIPMNRDQNYRIFEYACHEGNQAVENILRGGRAPKTRPPKTPRRANESLNGYPLPTKAAIGGNPREREQEDAARTLACPDRLTFP